MNGPIYSFDTSALIDGLERNYPETTFPGVWELVDELIDDHRFVISEEVFEEATHVDAAARQWCKPRKDRIVVPTDSRIAAEVANIGLAYPTWTTKGKNEADPFVIATARVLGATVVTGEKFNTGSIVKPKIPFVCQQVGVPAVNFLGFLQGEGWIFRRT